MFNRNDDNDDNDDNDEPPPPPPPVSHVTVPFGTSSMRTATRFFLVLIGIPVFYLAFLLAPIATNVSATGTEEGHGGKLAATCLTGGV